MDEVLMDRLARWAVSFSLVGLALGFAGLFLLASYGTGAHLLGYSLLDGCCALALRRLALRVHRNRDLRKPFSADKEETF